VLGRGCCWTLLTLLLGGCALPPAETPAETAARREIACQAAGFTPDSPELRLCLLLQQTNERLAAVEHRLTWIEQQMSLGRRPYGPAWWW
jgi:hypothetical protein